MGESPGAWGGNSAYVNFTVLEPAQESLDLDIVGNFKSIAFWDANPFYYSNWTTSAPCSHFGGVGTKEFRERSWLPF